MKRKRELNEHDMLEIALKDLTLKQLKLLKVNIIFFFKYCF